MTLLLLALALSMDSFAAALSRGAASSRLRVADALLVGMIFGVAQGVMPLIGWGLGLTFETTLRDVDHWIAFVLLVVIGGQMVYGARAAANVRSDTQPPSTAGWKLVGIAIATSIDAAAAGITLPLLDQPVVLACTVIGTVTLAFATAGMLIGGMVGQLAGRRAQMLGGVVLIVLGTKILIEHQFFGA